MYLHHWASMGLILCSGILYVHILGNFVEDQDNLIKFQLNNFFSVIWKIRACGVSVNIVADDDQLWPLLLTWFSFNPSMDK